MADARVDRLFPFLKSNCQTILIVLTCHSRIDAAWRQAIEKITLASYIGNLRIDLQLHDLSEHRFDDVVTLQRQRDPSLVAQGVPSKLAGALGNLECAIDQPHRFFRLVLQGTL